MRPILLDVDFVADCLCLKLRSRVAHSPKCSWLGIPRSIMWSLGLMHDLIIVSYIDVQYMLALSQSSVTTTLIIIPFNTCGPNSHNTHTILPNLQIREHFNFHWAILKSTDTCSFTICFKKISVYVKVFVDCKTWFGELKGASSSFQSATLIHVASSNTKKSKRACIERF